MRLNPEQAQAVSFKDGPCLVLAGPGSGKTAVITNRLLFLIENHGINPAHLLTLTFTKAAALEMQSRFYKLSDSKYPEVSFGTFHSVFYQILRQARKEQAPAFMKSYDPYRLTEHIFKEENMKYSSESIRRFLKAMSAYKNGRREEAKELEQGHADSFLHLIHRYDHMRKDLNLIGFDDILPDCQELFRTHPHILHEWQERFRYIQTDEFQDVNEIQLHLLEILASPGNNLFVVGDDDQAIYAFRGASPSSMLDFHKRFRSNTTIRLSVNYRSVPEIVSAAGETISMNTKRLKKEISPFRTSSLASLSDISQSAAGSVKRVYIKGASVSMDFYEDEQDEKEALTVALQNLVRVNSGVQSKEKNAVAVLTRTNHQAAILAVLFSEKGLPFYMKEKPVALTDLPQTQDICAYLRAGAGRVERSDFLRIMNKPVRFISRESAGHPVLNRNVLRHFYEHKPYMIKTTDKLFRDLELIGRLSPARAIDFIRKGIGYERYCRLEMDAQEYAKAADTMDLLQEKAGLYTDTTAFLEGLEEEKNRLSKLNHADDKLANRHEQIRLMTLHASKGLEFHTVFIPFLNEGLLPQRHAQGGMAREEERRLLYVGMTRACDRLILSCVQNTRKKVSSFLTPLLANAKAKTYKKDF